MMGIFDRFKKKQGDLAKEEIVEVPWHVLSELPQVDEIVATSKTKPVAVFKHSTTCGISKMALRNFERSYTLTDADIKLYYLDLKANRNVSNEVANKFQVMHESPQLILVKNGIAVLNRSHQSIDAGELEKLI